MYPIGTDASELVPDVSSTFASNWILFDLFELRRSSRSSKNPEAHRVEFRDGLPYRRRYA